MHKRSLNRFDDVHMLGLIALINTRNALDLKVSRPNAQMYCRINSDS